MATGGRTARGVLASGRALAGVRARGIANAGWVLSVADARLAARRWGEGTVAAALISPGRRMTRRRSDATEGAPTKSKAFATAAIRQRPFENRWHGRAGHRNSCGQADAPAVTCPELAGIRIGRGAQRSMRPASRPPPSDSAVPDGMHIITDRSCRLASARVTVARTPLPETDGWSRLRDH